MSQQEVWLTQVRNAANVTLDVLLANTASNDSIIYAAANTALAVAESAYGEANGAYTAANNALAVAESAYGQANTATTSASGALTVAQEAYAQANQAYANSNTAFNNSGVGAGQYGSSAYIPSITVDARGRITAASNVVYQTFGSTQSGIVPASGGGTTNFLRADGSWAQPTTILVAGSTSNYTRTSGLSNDPDLQLTLSANHVYEVTARLYITCASSLNWTMNFSGTLTEGYFHFLQNNGDEVYGGTFGTNIGSQGGTQMIQLQAIIQVGASGGVIAPQWGVSGSYNATRYGGSTITAVQCV